jgi:hypothetical protein
VVKIPGRAGSKADKKDLLSRLLTAWLTYPDMRLGQLIFVATSGRDIFYDEDEPLLREIEEYVRKNRG